MDADACPGRGIIVRAARARALPVILFCNDAHELADDYAEVRVCDRVDQSVDLAIANAMTAADLVVTQDYGLAALALGRGARALGPTGRPYTNENIDALLDLRHAAGKARRAGRHTRGPAKRNREDDARLAAALEELLPAATAPDG